MDRRERERFRSIASQYATPTYVFDVGKLSQRVNLIREKLAIGTEICFAMKANPFLTGTLAKQVDRLEVCSPGEYEICIREQINPEKIVVSGVNKTLESMERILSYSQGVGIYTIESPLHYEILKQCAGRLEKKLRVLLRLSSGNQFGMDETALGQVLAEIQKDNCMEVIGIHYYAGTQKNAKKIENELQYLNEYGARLRQEFGLECLELEYGPGLMVSYFENAGVKEQEAADAVSQLDRLKELLEKMTAYDHISIELGRFLTAECGYYMTKVMDRKQTDGAGFAIVDGGIHQINYYGQMMGMKKPYMQILQGRETEEGNGVSHATEKWTICGSLCTINDVLVRQVEIAPFNIGDIFVFERCGAYSVTEGMAMFLSRELPQVLLVDNDGTIEVMRKKTQINTWNGRMEEK